MQIRSTPDLRQCLAREILARADQALEALDRELLTDYWNELRRRSRKRPLHELERTAQKSGVLPIPWPDEARSVIAGFERETQGRHHIYFILLGGFGRDGSEYGVYVGETYRRPEVRFEQQKTGVHASGVVQRRGLQLLPSLYRALSPLGRAEAKRLERSIAEALRDAGIRIKGGHRGEYRRRLLSARNSRRIGLCRSAAPLKRSPTALHADALPRTCSETISALLPGGLLAPGRRPPHTTGPPGSARAGARAVWHRYRRAGGRVIGGHAPRSERRAESD